MYKRNFVFFLVFISFFVLVSLVSSSPVLAGTLPQNPTTITKTLCESSANSGGKGGTCVTHFPTATVDGCTGGETFAGFCDSNSWSCCVSNLPSTTITTNAQCTAVTGAKCSPAANDGNCNALNVNTNVWAPIGNCDSPYTTCCLAGAAGGGTDEGSDFYCQNTLKGQCFPETQGCPVGGSRLGTCATDAAGARKICCSSASTESSLRRLNYTLLEEIPGQSGAGGDLGSYLEGLYKFTFWAIGIAALFMLTIGGFMYVTSAGNTSRLGTAKTIIVDSFLGIIIALFAWLFLYVLNPDLVQGLRLPGLSTTIQTPTTTTTTTTTPGTTCPSQPNTSSACCPSSLSIVCQACSNCVAIPSSVPNKGCGLSTCFLNSSLLSKIQAISGVSGWRITESWPPTVNHLSKCHTDGTCADINNSGGKTEPVDIKPYYDAFRAAGLNVLYENAKSCDPYTAMGINCRSYPTQTNLSSFHVY